MTVDYIKARISCAIKIIYFFFSVLMIHNLSLCYK